MLNSRGVQTRRTDLSGYDYVVNAKINGEMVMNTLEPTNQYHLCNDCALDTFFSCDKTLYPEKKPIADYDFITDGYELNINDDLEKTKKASLEKFVVTKCKRYRKGN